MIRDQVAIVTGEAKGLGRHIARKFVTEGAKVALANIDVARLEKVAADLEKSGGEVLPIKANVRNEDEVRALVAQTLDRFRRVDILVNNAAVVTHSHWWSSPLAADSRYGSGFLEKRDRDQSGRDLSLLQACITPDAETGLGAHRESFRRR
jgi:NAD(P)-dependent dehydrogenase (short-subunit alcohol dehydrogenase family)